MWNFTVKKLDASVAHSRLPGSNVGLERGWGRVSCLSSPRYHNFCVVRNMLSNEKNKKLKRKIKNKLLLRDLSIFFYYSGSMKKKHFTSSSNHVVALSSTQIL